MRKLTALSAAAVFFAALTGSAMAQYYGRQNPYAAANNWAAQMNGQLCASDPGCNGEDGTPSKLYYGGGYGYRPAYRPYGYGWQPPVVIHRRVIIHRTIIVPRYGY